MPKSARLFSSPKLRLLACLLGALIAATLITAGAGIYLPMNEIDRIGVPILLFPVTWTLLFLYAAMVKKLWHAWLLFILLSLVHVGLIYQHLAG
ncbi:hypothetical protein [Gilvimarinus sp. DA14]|uniref:hypothetical protein n=1 Tax=Gilvimarinus sp. DA14 TaxID=2956798 RepID=UPI0020B700FC|nr:hypothetical protein [Gilvimarinus sp. DA14]UTF60604.1 hypothetical protein NHM04_02065 [Gilvimarinus sp. DA14]